MKLAYKRWGPRIAMHSHCPACGDELHRVAVDHHNGVFVQGLVYWQYCYAYDCTWTGRPKMYQAYMSDENEVS